MISGDLLSDRGNPKPVLCDNLKGWDAEGGRFKREETYANLWLIHAEVRQKPSQYCKVIILSLKIKLNKI